LVAAVLDARKLAYFVTVADSRSVSSAARVSRGCRRPSRNASLRAHARRYRELKGRPLPRSTHAGNQPVCLTQHVMHPPPTLLPLLPTGLLRRYNCAEPNDTRFRAVARLRQFLWRE
jgi:hypothetical protein